MKLYYSPGACSLGPHIALRESEQRFDLERVDLKSHRTASGKSFYEINPRGYVPVLELDGDERLTEAQVVLQYIADLAPERALAPPPATFERFRLLEWLSFISSELHKQFGPLFSDDYAAVHEKQRGKIGERLTYLEEVFEDRPFLMGDAFTIADAYLFVTLRWCEKQKIDLAIWTHVEAYYQRLLARPAVLDALKAEGIAPPLATSVRAIGLIA